jgi:hypothetical protein
MARNSCSVELWKSGHGMISSRDEGAKISAPDEVGGLVDDLGRVALEVWIAARRKFAAGTGGMTVVAAAAAGALDLDDGLAEAHAALGAEKGAFEYDWQGARFQFKRAIELNSNSAQAHFQLSISYLTPRVRSSTKPCGYIRIFSSLTHILRGFIPSSETTPMRSRKSSSIGT